MGDLGHSQARISPEAQRREAAAQGPSQNVDRQSRVSMGAPGSRDHGDHFVRAVHRALESRREAGLRANAGERRGVAAEARSDQRSRPRGIGEEAGRGTGSHLEQLSQVPGGFEGAGYAIIENADKQTKVSRGGGGVPASAGRSARTDSE